MRMLCFIGVAVLLLGGTAAAEDAKTLRAEAIVAEGPFPTQRTDLAMFRPLGAELVLGDRSHAVEQRDRGLRIGGAKVGRGGGVIRLDVSDERDVRVAVRRAEASGVWEWAVVEARRLEIGDAVVELLDANADGRLTLEGDAVRYPPSRFLLPLTGDVVAGRHRLTLASIDADGMRVTGVVQPLAGSRHQLDGLVVINELRAAHGLPPLVVDDELSAACSAHARFLVKNKWRPGKFNPHGEWRGGKGFSEAGHRAAMMSVIAWSDHGDAARAYWDSYYHRFPLAHPSTTGLGISDGSPSVSVIDGKSLTGRGGADGWHDPVLVPADGSALETGAFHRGGESPEPVEQCANKGFPFTVQFHERDPGVTDFAARLISIDRKGRTKDVPLLAPVSRGAKDRFGVLPELPLRAGVDYVVTYTYRRHGEPEERIARFRVE
jgi:hypothetical protein